MEVQPDGSVLMTARTVLLALIVGGSMLTLGCAWSGQSINDLTGSWIVTNTPSGEGERPFVSVATFTSDGGFVGAAQGSGACCPILTPGHGVWERTGANAFAVAFASIAYDADGNLVGRMAGRLTIQLDEAADRINGEFRGTMVDRDGNELFSIEGTLQGERVKVQSTE